MNDGSAAPEQQPPRRQGRRATPRESASEILRRAWRSRKFAGGLFNWFAVLGLPLFVVLGGLLVGSGMSNGWWLTYELLVTITSPRDAPHMLLGLGVSLSGWLVVPAGVGALAGFVVERRITSYRGSTVADVSDRLSRRARIGEGR